MSTDIIQTLVDERQAAWKAAKDKLELAATEKRELSADEQVLVDRTIGSPAEGDKAAVKGELDALDDRIKQLTDLEKRAVAADTVRERVERATVETPETARAIKREEDEVRSFLNGEKRTVESRITDPVARWLHMDPKERRDVLTSSTGAPVPTSFADRLTMHLVQIGPMWDTSTVMRTDSGENIQFPRTSAHGASTFKAEGSALDETQPTFATFITLGAWKYGTFQQYSYELLADSGIDILGYIADQAAISIAVVTNTAFTTGNDSSAPNGIVPASTLGVTGANAVTGAFTSDNLLELLYSVGPQYRRLNASWQMRDASILAARKLKDGNGAYIYVPGLSAAEPDTLLAYPLNSNPDVVATGLSAKSIIFGALSKYLIRQAGAIRFERSDEFAFTSDLSTFKIAIRVDGDLLDQTGAVKHFIGGAS